MLVRHGLPLALLLVATVAADARYCNSPSCAMCNRIFGPMSGYEVQWLRDQTRVDPAGGPNIIQVR